jgi:serine/threonine protein kinase
VKEFHHKRTLIQQDDPTSEDAFAREHKILQKIKYLPHQHIIRHFVSIDQGNKGYIVSPWADGGDLQYYWENSKVEISRKRAIWSLRQMAGLATALDLLHETLNCRHGDLKPLNVLCFTESGETVLKIADFGIAKIHNTQTMFRKAATTTLGLTPSYQGPEVEFEKVNRTEPLPRSRKYDIWSLGCIFLEFSIWLLYGAKAIEEFRGARGSNTPSTDSSLPLYEITDKVAKAARVHQLVSWTIETILHDDPRCQGDTALVVLLNLIQNQMLQPAVENRPSAREVGKQLEGILLEAEKCSDYLFRSGEKFQISQLNFNKFQSV